jgi:hypothetical protein
VAEAANVVHVEVLAARGDGVAVEVVAFLDGAADRVSG